MNKLIVDTNTSGHREILRRLARLVSTNYLTDNGSYTNCPECSQLSVETTMTEMELDNWLWKNRLDYIGVVQDSATDKR